MSMCNGALCIEQCQEPKKQSWARDNLLASRQRDNVILPQGPETNQKIVRPLCLDGIATINIVKW